MLAQECFAHTRCRFVRWCAEQTQSRIYFFFFLRAADSAIAIICFCDLFLVPLDFSSAMFADTALLTDFFDFGLDARFRGIRKNFEPEKLNLRKKLTVGCLCKVLQKYREKVYVCNPNRGNAKITQ